MVRLLGCVRSFPLLHPATDGAQATDAVHSKRFPDMCAQVVARQLGVAAAAATAADDAAALLHALRGLAADRVWNVRRAAAEALPDVARAQRPAAASETLLELLAALMADASSWVKSAAMLAAGTVIGSAPHASVPPGKRQEMLYRQCKPSLHGCTLLHQQGAICWRLQGQ